MSRDTRSREMGRVDLAEQLFERPEAFGREELLLAVADRDEQEDMACAVRAVDMLEITHVHGCECQGGLAMT